MITLLYNLSILLAIISAIVHAYLWTQNTPANFLLIGVLFGFALLILIGNAFWALIRKQHTKLQKSFFKRTPLIAILIFLILFFYPFIAGIKLDSYGTLKSSDGSYYLKLREYGKFISVTKEEYDRRFWGQSTMFTGSALSIWFLNCLIFRSMGPSKITKKRDSA